MKRVSEDTRMNVSELYRRARSLLEPGEEHLNPEYARALIELLTEAEGLTMEDKPLVARRLKIPKEHIMDIC